MQNRIALRVEYNGATFHGWQMQKERAAFGRAALGRAASGRAADVDSGPQSIDTIQQRLEGALSRVANHPVSLICAGRTDRGVHATAQIAHFETRADRQDKAWVLGTNAHLPPEISVRWAGRVDEAFHARFSALARRYIYLIYNSPVRSALLPGELTREVRPLDVELMQEGAHYLLGEQDFSSFRAAACQSNTPMRNVMSLEVSRMGDVVMIDIEANAFLHHMVRNIAGVLMDVGAGLRPPGWVAELLASRDRNLASPTAGAQGLYLVQVKYPARFGLADHASLPHLFGLLNRQ